MELYREIGRLVCERPDKSAASTAAEYLQKAYLNAAGFSPRNLRRMRDFYKLYGGNADFLNLAMQVGWTQNIVILEADLAMDERTWYLKAFSRNQKIIVNRVCCQFSDDCISDFSIVFTHGLCYNHYSISE